MSSLPGARAEPVGIRGAPLSLRYLPHVLVATAFVSLLPIGIVWVLRDRGAISSPWVALPLAVGLSLVAAAVGSAWWSRRRRPEDLLFSELLLWGWLRRLYLDRQIERAVGLLSLASPADHPDHGDMTVERRTQLLSELAAALEAQDPYLQGHSRRVARHATMIARKVGLNADEVSRLRVAAVLHDVGKLHVPQRLLNKPGRLSAAEFDRVKVHADEGAKMVAGLGDDQLTSIVRHHHERMDGTGYPDGLRGLDIPLGARIIAVADMYDAITAARPYRPAAPHKQALDTLRDESPMHLDPALVHAFRGSYSGRGPLAFWESLAAWIQAVHFLPQSAAVTAKRLSLHELLTTTLTTTAVAVAAIAAPIGPTGVDPHLAAAPVALSMTHTHQPTSGLGRPHRAPVHARRSARVAAHRRTPSTRAPLATPRLTQTPAIYRGTAPGTGRIRSSPHTPGPTPPSTHPPRPPAHQPPGQPPRPTSPRPPTTTPVRPPQTAPATPGNGTAQTTTSPQTTAIPPAPPATSTTERPTGKDACKNGGYIQYGSSNQGRCVAAAEHGG